jgi:hypothetical protein
MSSAPEAPKGRVTFTNVQAKAKPLFLARTAPRRIENICSTTGIPNAWQSCLHVEARNDVLWRAAMGALKDYLPLSVQTPTVSLRNLIKSRRKLSTKAKLIIAVLVAHAMLHLSESPWLDRQFLDKDLCFCQMTSRGVDISHPYLTTKFPANDEEPLPEADSPPHPYSSLLGLGIILIELHTEKLIESYHSPDDLIGGKQNLSSDMTAAHRLATTKDAWDVNQRYRSAVQACLEPTILGEIETEIQFQQAIYSQIVAPLEFEAFEAYGITEDMLYDPFYLTEDMSSNPFHLPMSETRVVMANTPITSSTGSNRPREPRVDNEEGESDDNQEDRVYDVLLLPESKADKEKLVSPFLHRLKCIILIVSGFETQKNSFRGSKRYKPFSPAAEPTTLSRLRLPSLTLEFAKIILYDRT